MNTREYKVVLLGDSGVGKSSIVLRFVANEFQISNEPTLGSAFTSKLYDHKGSMMRYQIWDTAGQEKYHALATMYFRDADVAIVAYDITNSYSFEVLRKWLDEIKEKAPDNIILAIVGNKNDLSNQEQITTKEAADLANSHKAIFIKTSAKESKGIDELFTSISERIEEREEKVQTRPSKSRLSTKKTPKDKKARCCST
eukprot:TRINITY_DN4073_c0_g2_i2.p1 TRINITY_DN4073_c0_g2~~TRINITY_DN4073_c0_g2_i2.p1  ORF type:complete len:199 (-),score=32.42 TRINITY_DN4073_c0_g2_i2:126-722(-)